MEKTEIPSKIQTTNQIPISKKRGGVTPVEETELDNTTHSEGSATLISHMQAHHPSLDRATVPLQTNLFSAFVVLVFKEPGLGRSSNDLKLTT